MTIVSATLCFVAKICNHKNDLFKIDSIICMVREGMYMGMTGIPNSAKSIWGWSPHIYVYIFMEQPAMSFCTIISMVMESHAHIYDRCCGTTMQSHEQSDHT